MPSPIIPVLLLLLFPGEIASAGHHGRSIDEPGSSNSDGKQFDTAPNHEAEDNKERNLVIEIAIKFSDGGDVLLNKEVELGGTKYPSYKVLKIEEVLKWANGIEDVKYVEKPKNEEMPTKDHKVPEKDGVGLAEEVEAGGKIHFARKFEQIRAMPKGEKAEKDIHFEIPAGKMDIEGKKMDTLGKEVDILGKKVDILGQIKELAEVDWRWHVTGKDEDEKEHLFQALFDGHAMVALSEKIKDKQNPNKMVLREVARFHFNSKGLNLFRKHENDGKGVTYIVDGELSEKEAELVVVRNRGLYRKHGFPEELSTRKLSILDLKRIAHKIIAGRPWGKAHELNGPGGVFKCHHFVYTFIQAIVEPDRAKLLEEEGNWPENMRVMDHHYKDHLDGSYAFHSSVPFNLEKWVEKVKEHEKHAATAAKEHAEKQTKEEEHPPHQPHHPPRSHG